MKFPRCRPAENTASSFPRRATGRNKITTLEISADPGRQELDPVELKPANLKLAGQVLDADDKPVAGCNVNLSGDDQPNANARTDRDGRFSFAHVCEGTIRLSANSQRAFGNISAEGGDTNVVLHLGENMRFFARLQTAQTARRGDGR